MISSTRNDSNLCRFCALKRKASLQMWDRRLMSDGSVLVVPTKGPIVAPWLLLIPQSHVPTAMLLPDDEKESISRLIKKLQYFASISGLNLTIFENGAPYFGADISCGIDHVHIHMVALNFDLAHVLRAKLPEIEKYSVPWSTTTQRPKVPYVFVNNGINQHYFDASSAKSQLIRQVISEAIGKPQEFHYDIYPNERNVIGTIDWFDSVSKSLVTSAGHLS